MKMGQLRTLCKSRGLNSDGMCFMFFAMYLNRQKRSFDFGFDGL